MLLSRYFRYSISGQCWDDEGWRGDSPSDEKKRCQCCWGGQEGVSGEKHCGFTLASRATSINQPSGCQRCLKGRGYAAISVSVGQIAFRMMSLVSPPTCLSSEWVIKTAAATTTAATSAFLSDWRWFFHLSGLSHPLDSKVSEGFEPPAGWMGGERPKDRVHLSYTTLAPLVLDGGPINLVFWCGKPLFCSVQYCHTIDYFQPQKWKLEITRKGKEK